MNLIKGQAVYSGKTTNCYTQAILSSFMQRYNIENVYNFEMATTIPFGIIFRSGDPNRLLDCYLDPDFGLDRALDILNIPFDIKYWPSDSNVDEALYTLNAWCRKSPVVLGPLNMRWLTYFFREDLYKNMDHYIVVIGKEGGYYSVCDPEGIGCVLIKEEELVLAWKADEILEGRGEFIMRRVCESKHEIVINELDLNKIFKHSVENLENAENLKNGGSNGLELIYKDYQSIEATPSIIRGFSYAIPTRIQRCMLSKMLLEKILIKSIFNEVRINLQEAILALDNQICLYGEILNKLRLNVKVSLKMFDKIAFYENRITYLLSSVKDSV